MEKLTVSSTSKTSAHVVQPTVLSQTATTRRIFRPEIVRKPDSADWQVKGSLIHQRKSSGGDWEDEKQLKLNQLRSGEGVCLNLNSEEVSKLIESLAQLREIAEQYGIRLGRQRSFVIADQETVVVVTDRNRKSAIEQLLQRKYGKEFWDTLSKTDPDLATRLSYSRIQQERQQALAQFTQGVDRQEWSEGEWERFFSDNEWIFGYGLRYQFLNVVQRQAHYGGGTVTGKGEQRGEFLAATAG